MLAPKVLISTTTERSTEVVDEFLEQHGRRLPVAAGAAHPAALLADHAGDESVLHQLAQHADHDVPGDEPVAVFPHDRLDFVVEKAAQPLDRQLLLFAAKDVTHDRLRLPGEDVDGDHGLLDAVQAAAVFLDGDARPLDLAGAGLAAQLGRPARGSGPARWRRSGGPWIRGRQRG